MDKEDDLEIFGGIEGGDEGKWRKMGDIAWVEGVFRYDVMII